MPNKTKQPNQDQVPEQVFMRPRLKVEDGAIEEDALLFSFDLGTGICVGFSSDIRRIISFEPVVSPLSEKRDVKFKSDEKSKPRFSLREEDGQVYVFGVRDVVEHGKYAQRRRLTSMDRSLSPDYFRLFRVMLFQAFKRFAGNGEWIRPSGAISVPIAIYNDDKAMAIIREAVVGKHVISDMDGCLLRVEIAESRFLIVPESYGLKYHQVYDATTLQLREDASSGSSIVTDIGYETVNAALYFGTRYQRDIAYTLERGGFGIATRAVQAWAGQKLKGMDPSRIDVALRAVAGIPLGQPKFIEVAPGVSIDVQPVYDIEVPLLAERVSQYVATLFADVPATDVVLGGGTAYHLAPYITQEQIGWPVYVCPDPDVANALGVLTKLYREALKRKK